MSAQQAQPARSQLLLESGRGAYIAGDHAALWSRLTDRPDIVFLEAEDAAVLELDPGREVVADNTLSGGGAIVHVVDAQYPFSVEQAGEYEGWGRIWLPRPGSWTHQESMDGGHPGQVRDSADWRFGEWYWSRLGSYTLGAGDHTFRLHGFRAGAMLDAILFSADPDFRPTDLAGVAAEDPAAGVIASAPLLPSAVASWDALRLDADDNGGGIASEVSADGGATWQTPGPDGSLAGLPARGDGADTLRARFTLTAAPDGRSPVLRQVAVDYTLTPDAEVTLANDHYRLAVARATGRLAGIRNLAADLDVTAPHLQQPLLALALREPGAKQVSEILPNAIRCEGVELAGDTLTIRYAAPEAVRATVTLTADDSALGRWSLAIDNGGGQQVSRIDFPLIRGAAVGDWRDDEAVLPRTGGWRVPQPATSKTWMTTYMGGGSMSWMDLCDPAAGLYLAMHDPKLTSTEMECAPAAGNQGADLSFRAFDLVPPGGRAVREYAVGVHEGDWHWGADRYREWALSWMTLPDNPEWLRTSDGWIGAMGTPFAGMAALHRQAQRMGFDYLQYWSQMADGIDQCCGNFPWPAPALGGEEGWKAGIEQVHAQGGQVTGYMNCQTWTRDAPINDALRRTPKADLPPAALALIHSLEWFEKWRLFPLDGEPQPYTLGWFIMCPASTGFQEHLKFWMIDKYADEYNTDGVYLDQAGATLAKPCYNLEHGHEGIGAWGRGNLETIRAAVEQGRRHNPDYVMSIEGSADALGQYAGLHLISGLCTHPEVYHYTFPEHILISGLSNNSPLSYHQRISRAFLNGDRFDGRVEAPGLPSAARLRRRIKHWLYPARFMDTIGLSVSDERVLARWNVLEEEGNRAIVVAFDNEQKVAGATCALALPEGWEQARLLALFDREGGVTAQAPTIAGGTLTFEVPASTLSGALLLAGDVAPAHAVDVWQAASSEAGTGDRLVLNAVNLGTAPVEATVLLTPDAPLSAQAEHRLALGAGETLQWTVPLSGTERLETPAGVLITLRGPGGERSEWTYARPLLLNPSLALDADIDGKADYWGPGGTTGSFEHGLEDGAAWIQGQPQHYQYLMQGVPLQPNTTYRFAGEIKRSAPTEKVSIAVAEALAPRGLRMHILGNSADLPAGEWQRFETTFTTQENVEAWRVYLYNTNTDVRAWYRNLELEEVE